LVDLGWNRLVDVAQEDIAAVAMQAIGARGDESVAPYGHGNSANQIYEHLLSVI
jgi:UDP-N-acetylglucosamine 2-epimerase